MQDLVARITESLGIESSVAEKAIGIILKMLKENIGADKVDAILGSIPGAEEFINKAPEASEAAGGGLMAAVGGLMGGGSGLMDAVGQLQGIGLDIPQAQGVAKELVEYTREKAGPDLVNDALKEIPGIDMVL